MQVVIKSAQQVHDERQAVALRTEEAVAAAAKAVEVGLEGLVWTEFDQARRAKETVQHKMLNLLRARKNEYSAEELMLIRSEGGGSEMFLPLPQEKVATAVAWLNELYGGDRPFDCVPTPIPKIPPEMERQIEAEAAMRFQLQGAAFAGDPEAMRHFAQNLKARYHNEVRQWAKQRAEHNTEKVNDVLKEGGFYPALMDAFDDLCGLKAGFVHGPLVKMKQVLDWGADGRTATRVRKAVRTFEAPSPFDVYPAAGSGDVQHSHISIRLRLQAFELQELIGVEGFREDRITDAIKQYGTDGLQNWFYEDTERADLEGRSIDTLITQKGLYDVIQHYTFATGKMLREWGMPGLNDAEVYSISTWMLGRNILIGARINDDPLGERPLIKLGFRRVRGAFWCDGVTDIIWQLVKLGNAAARALCNNMAMSAGFYTEIQTDRLASGEPPRQPAPYSVIQTVSPLSGTAGPAVYVHQGEIHAQVYIAIYAWVQNLCDAALGLPSFMSGTSTGGGAGDTSSGLAQLREMASRTFKFTVAEIDRQVAHTIDRVHTDIVLTEGETDPELNGDINIEVKGTKSFGDRQQQQVRLNEMVVATNNPSDLQIMGLEGRAELLRAAFKSFDGIDIDRTIPGRDELIYKAKAAMAAEMGVDLQGNPLPGAPGGQQPPKGRATNPDGSVQGDRGQMS